jgi:hypothetical protein
MARRDPVNRCLLTGSWGVVARSKDQEGAEEGGVGLLKKAAEGCRGFFGTEDHGEGREPLKMVCMCRGRKGAVENDVMACVTARYPVWGWGVGLVTRAGSVIVGSTVEAVRLVVLLQLEPMFFEKW